MITWQWSCFAELSRDDLFEIVKARQAVFIVEQQCIYQDADELDPLSWHLMGWFDDGARRQLIAYARVVLPGKKFVEPSIGRVLISPSFRGRGLGRVLTRETITRTMHQFPDSAIRISAQHYLEKFYSGFGFETVSAPYDEDGIAHVEMVRQPMRCASNTGWETPPAIDAG
jgi:ElaA protein